MYKLTKLDEFNIKNLLGLRRNGLNNEDLNQGIDYFLSMDNETLGYTINKILHVWENEYFNGITGKQKKLFDYCEELVEKLINGTEEGEVNDNVIEKNSLSNIDKLKLEKLFNMSEGYVLDFTNRSFKDFVNTITNIDIYSEKYSDLGDSKANRLRSFWNKENDKIVGKLLSDLLEQYKTEKLINGKELKQIEKDLFDECKQIIIRLNKGNKSKVVNNELDYVDYFSPEKIQEFKNIKSKDFNLLKIIKILEEVNICYNNACYLSVSSLLRMFIDHIPPIFGLKSFQEVVSSYKFSKSDKKNIEHLFGAMKNISDGNLHSHISKKEILPIKQTIEFRADFDILLKNIIIELSKNN